MAIMLNKLFVILRLALNRSLVACLCLFLNVLNAQDAPAKDLDGELAAGRIQRHEKRMGPFNIKEKDFSVILKVLKYQGSSVGFDETIESFSIVDQEGKVHFEKSFPIEYDNERFTENWRVGANVLDDRGLKSFRVDSGVLKKTPPKDRPGAGLVLYYGFVPSAPSSGESCQVFALKGEDLVSLFKPLTCYGEIYTLEPGSKPNARRLFENNTMRFGVWNRMV